MSVIRNISVIGGGYVGQGLAIQFARGGYQVSVYNRTKESSSLAMERVQFFLDLFEKNGLYSNKQAEDALSLIQPTTNLEEAARSADYVMESVSEDLSLKQDIFMKLDALCPPHVILASDTSGLRLSEIGIKANRKDKLIVVHHYTPTPLRPVVEIVRGAETSEETFQVTKKLLEDIDKDVVLVKEALGHIGVRISTAVRREAMYMLERGIASPEDIDKVAYNFGILPVFAGMDASGLDVFMNIHSYLQKDLDNRDTPSPLLKEKVDKGELGIKSGQGFFDWDEESVKKATDKRIKTLIMRMKEREIFQDPD
ncbi:MAG: 3-hydroxyacyl-CoA dehydrogenase family protein [Nitrospinaceae bacterium]|jgi:3-hydroxybutyryl-CoA dehydrogenase|nr:3-hydroxyacyl-CoA dehydrogenase family protein [Nitrospinaceae bacterium]MBT3434246.1 3-hydroxyacyl-CoA dehydrogenase family protein [Nitrospinaceae bacterium]MBT3819959.1 3-hydroxyacyl-CoA dehydrogenase family protein [Nitrospinaceae bacterium]MBT4093706.1 3-hydroxyacyl-CoA dehydrogenase family protein [Nitrospinaceae bacterium]MBT4432420.1 3-hydroxyacyl-CoA dehydrogenase family protein [Nitrospinaceae bacterium]